ncbi:Putative helicase, P-loop containing nucleoside triphosphate hydrolase, SNF2-like domain superfamily [Septoria linicola]|uniref:Helicase, P-loop containing nucleoside triphosphate hydrolase, SNF2-like domain superfamily n=1 Tax=Septoria linicola TaxID=215465 RepID=A0A9Q9EG57_9PEZI|nr:putative helicase, P-loop containing nucleoside triphosphate hydrolase, SNF2-like domain superfamily [Septoria linicola]USW49650.1 Putative helicase, P-loop containing nucleoside triphosphate hydrolase, SNF2-like domain superfamily [Septoria linicola]
MKPFKPPTMVNRPQTGLAASSHFTQPPPAKRRRISDDDEDPVATTAAAANVLKPAPSQGFQAPAVRTPLAPVSNGASQSSPGSEQVPENYFVVVWRKFTTKKNKTWDGDGVLSVKGTQAKLQNIDGKEFGRGACKCPLLVGSELSICGREIEVESMISKEDYVSGRVFLGNAKAIKSAPTPSLKEINETKRVTNKEQAKFKKLALTQKETFLKPAMSTAASKAGFKAPLMQNNVLASIRNARVPTPRHSLDTPNALVMKRPDSVPKGRQIVDVVVDPLLTKSLRPHQRQGVQFLYECVMGMKDYDGEGAILADEMGLGKTLQTITLLWTLLKQNPIADDPPVIKKALIVCPVSLVKNWHKEFRKWLGNERVGVYMVENNKMRLTDFSKGKAYQVMIIGYEKLTKVQKELQGASGIDIVICDEGHRLKTSTNKAATAIKTLSTERRVILSGTPVQNDLAEFHTMVDFVNPNILSKYTTFKREFETPIMKSRQPGAADNDLEKGEARSAELAELTGKFILRRTAEILEKYLPPKTEYVVFCRPTTIQAQIYRHIISSRAFATALSTPTVGLELIMILKKLCNHPPLLQRTNDKGEEIKRRDLMDGIPKRLLNIPGTSAKLQVLDELLVKIRNETDDKVVLVSNYTSTMDVLANLITSLGMSYLRLDGGVPQAKRQDMVDRFNRSPQSNSFVFLLSAKAGGTGLNLIGASRLIMYDLDWNPALDLQAMARIHRDGQKKPCYIYRLVTQGAMDEKIFQRQVTKTGLADSIVDGKAAASGFSTAELRDLFSLDEEDDCQTHRLLGCTCECNGLPVSEAVEQKIVEHVGRNDLAKLDSGPIEVLHLEDSDQEEAFLSKKCTTTLANVDRDAQEAELKRKSKENRDSTGKAKMLSLMQYTHFDTSLATRESVPGQNKNEAGDDDDDEVSDVSPVDTAIEDTALRNVIRDTGRRIGFVMTKMGTSRIDEESKDDIVMDE